MHRYNNSHRFSAIRAAACVASLLSSLVSAPALGGGNGNGRGGGGGAASDYTIIPLPSPIEDGSHYSVFKSISDPGPAGEVHVVGYHYYYPSDEDRPYCWTVDGVMQVVGKAYASSGGYPYLYEAGELSDLNQLAVGDETWEIQGADDINHAGMICGYGRVGKRRNYLPGNCLLVPTN